MIVVIDTNVALTTFKFSDCAITAEADYIVTEDRHFQALIGSGYKPQPITPAEFIQRHLFGK